MIGMGPRFSSQILALAIVVLLLGAVALSCGSVSTLPDGGGSAGAAGSSGGGTSGTAGTTGTGGTGGGTDGGPITCRVDVSGDCPNNFTCACGGPGPGMCTCHRNCNDVTACGPAEPLCGCPSTTSGPRFCVNACFCSCN